MFGDIQSDPEKMSELWWALSSLQLLVNFQNQGQFWKAPEMQILKLILILKIDKEMMGIYHSKHWLLKAHQTLGHSFWVTLYLMSHKCPLVRINGKGGNYLGQHVTVNFT